MAEDPPIIVDLTIADVLQCRYNPTTKLFWIGDTSMVLVCVCGRITEKCRKNDFSLIKIDDTTGSILCFFDYEEQPKEERNYVEQELAALNLRIDHDYTMGTGNRIPPEPYAGMPYQRYYNEELLRFIDTVNSIPYSDKLEIGHLVSIVGRLCNFENSRCIFRKQNKMLKITSDHDVYFKNWLNKCKEWKMANNIC